MNRYNQVENYVTPTGATPPAPSRKQQIARQAAELANVPATVIVDDALQTLEGSSERTTGMDRSLALVVRLLPFSAVWLTLSIGVGWAASMGGWFVLVMFAGLTSVTYAYLDRQEYQFSRNGLERHKVDTLAGLKRDEMSHQQELRRMALEAHLKMLGVDDERR
ncbi:MAG: hypothetical protein R3C14_42700 [Caldilineaceae bacterium]